MCEIDGRGGRGKWRLWRFWRFWRFAGAERSAGLTAQRRPGRPRRGGTVEIRPAAVAAAFAVTPDVNGHVPNLSRECRQAYATTLLSFVKSGSAKTGPMARDVFTIVLLEQQWVVRSRGRHSQRYATQGEAVTAAVEAVLATQLWSWAKSPLRDFQNAVPDESGQQGSDHGGTENDETEKLPSHGFVPAMPNFRVNPSSSMAQCCPALRRVNRDTRKRAPLSEIGHSTPQKSRITGLRCPVDASARPSGREWAGACPLSPPAGRRRRGRCRVPRTGAGDRCRRARGRCL